MATDDRRVRRLSRGSGATEVWAVRQGNGEVVAAKCLTDAGRAREDLTLRFAQEGRILARLGGRHHLVGCHAAREFELLLELAELGSVRDQIDRAPIAVPTALRIIHQAIDAASWLHQNGVIHRDIKPSNLLVVADGTIRLADLGVAAVGRPPRGLPPPWVEEAVGTLGYAAPELLRNPEAAHPGLDVYGLGVTLYEMVSGMLPYSMGLHETEAELRVRIGAGPLPAPLPDGLDGSTRLREVVARAIAPEPADRYATVSEFGAALATLSGASG